MGYLIGIIVLIIGFAVGYKLVFQKKKEELESLRVLDKEYETHISTAVDLMQKEIEKCASSTREEDSIEKMKRLMESCLKLKEIKFKN